MLSKIALLIGKIICMFKYEHDLVGYPGIIKCRLCGKVVKNELQWLDILQRQRFANEKRNIQRKNL